MKQNRKYIIILVATIVLFVVFNVFSPKKINWTPTFSAQDKDPFGSFLVDTLLTDLFPKRKIYNSNLTVYELDSLVEEGDNLIAIATSLSLGNEDVDVLLNAVNDGAHVLLSANFFARALADTIGLYPVSALFNETFNPIDTTYIEFTNPSLKKKRFKFRLEDAHMYFDRLDSLKMPAFVVARNSYKKPVTLRIPIGKGQLIVNTTPHAFTNHYLLSDNHELIEGTVSYLPAKDTWWTEYYQLGRRESTSTLRAILNSEALSWAYYTMIATLIIFMIVEARRKQRIIPVIKPLPNTTLEFVRTIGNMYIQTGNHKSIAEKQINYFLDHVRSTYFLPDEHHESFAEKLSKKSGNSLEETRGLISLIRIIRESSSISPEMLLDLNKRIERFSHTK